MRPMLKFSAPLPCGCLMAVHTGFTAKGEACVRCLEHGVNHWVKPELVADWGQERPRLSQVERNRRHQERMTGVPYHPEGEK